MFIPIATLVLCSSLLCNSILNSFLLRRVRNNSYTTNKSVAVLLPMRNEAENIEDLVACLQKQSGADVITFHCLDDQSTDQTFEFLTEATNADQRFLLHRGQPLPDGWLGKPFALQQALDLSSSEIVVVVDSDVRLKPHAIASAINTLETLQLDFISAYPRQIALSWPERLIQPLLQWSWMTTVPLRIAERVGNSSFAVANGQFFVVRRDALSKVDDFRKISHEVLDDISLARVLLRAGFRGAVSDASQVASCRMYKTWNEIKSGYGKSLRIAFRSPIGFVITITFLFFCGVMPLVLALSGSTLGSIALLTIILSRVISAASSGGKILDSIFHPFSTVALIYLIIYSILRRNTITWKGRPV